MMSVTPRVVSVCLELRGSSGHREHDDTQNTHSDSLINSTDSQQLEEDGDNREENTTLGELTVDSPLSFIGDIDVCFERSSRVFKAALIS